MRPIDSDQITQAIADIRADPALNESREISGLQWLPSPSRSRLQPPEWLIDFLNSIGQFGRIIFWVLLAALIAFLAVQLVRIFRETRRAATVPTPAAPEFVGELDIRPESLPEDIAASVRILWGKGEHRAALSLLYRGLLSRLVHQHGLPVRASSTEGDCMRLLRSHPSPARQDYSARLIGLWQKAVYGHTLPETSVIDALCNDFERVLAHSSATADEHLQ